MKNTGLILTLLMLLTIKLFSQPILVKLTPQNEQLIEGRAFYIIKVIDNRADRGKKIGEYGKREIMLEEFLERSFVDYLSRVFPQNNLAKTSVTMVINAIECSKETAAFSSKIKVGMDADLISTSFNDATYKVKVSNSVDRIRPDSKTYENLISRNLNDIMQELKEITK